MIPKVIHQMWIGPPLPLHIARMMKTWKLHHPGWEYALWTERNLFELGNQELWDKAEMISPRAPWQFRSDVARYEILFHQGGIWADADFICQRPLDLLLDDHPFAGQETPRWLNNALIGAPAGHPMLLDLIAKLPANVAGYGPGAGNTVKSGPQYFTPIARHYGITEYPQRYFYPYGWNELDRGSEDYPDAYAVHHWSNQRRIQRKPLATV